MSTRAIYPGVNYPAFSQPNNLMSRVRSIFRLPVRSGSRAVSGSRPRADILQFRDKYEVRFHIPGYKAENVQFTVEKEMITVSGKRYDMEVPGASYIYQETYAAGFHRRLPIPADALIDSAEATFEDGILFLTIKRRGKMVPSIMN